MPDELAASIESLRKSLGKRLCVMGHHYESDDIIRHCDVTGDSLELSRKVPEIDAEFIVFCGVSFMGESAALLAKPGQKVLLPAPEADCQMARMADADDARTVLQQLKEQGLNFLPLAYVNTSVALKAVVGEFGGTVCTSANAKKMMDWAFSQSNHVLFLPDMHLGRNVARTLNLTEQDWFVLNLGEHCLSDPTNPVLSRKLLLWPGYCPIHGAYTPKMVKHFRDSYPNCRITVHPEASPEVVAACDDAGSTSFLIKDAAALDKKRYEGTLVVGTEINLVRRLMHRHEGRVKILPLSEDKFAACPDMALITPKALYNCIHSIEDKTYEIVQLHNKDIEPARLALTRMLEVCK